MSSKSRASPKSSESPVSTVSTSVEIWKEYSQNRMMLDNLDSRVTFIAQLCEQTKTSKTARCFAKMNEVVAEMQSLKRANDSLYKQGNKLFQLMRLGVAILKHVNSIIELERKLMEEVTMQNLKRVRFTPTLASKSVRRTPTSESKKRYSETS